MVPIAMVLDADDGCEAAVDSADEAVAAGSDEAAAMSSDEAATAAFVALLDGLELPCAVEGAAPTEKDNSILRLNHPPLTIPWMRGHSFEAIRQLDKREDGTPTIPAILAQVARSESGAVWVLNSMSFEDTEHGKSYAAAILQRHYRQMRVKQAVDVSSLPLTTGEALYLPCTYTLLAYLLSQPSLISGRRVIELGAGLGLTSSVVQQMSPPPARLVCSDGDASLLALLQANLDANFRAVDMAGHSCSELCRPRRSAPITTSEHTKVATEVIRLLWGELPLPAGLAAGFDLVIAADAIFSATAPQRGHTRDGTDAATSRQVHALFMTAATLLSCDTTGPPARLVLTAEPRDRLKAPSSDVIRALVPTAAAAAGLVCVECHERRLTGIARPDWQTDLLVFERRSNSMNTVKPGGVSG